MRGPDAEARGLILPLADELATERLGATIGALAQPGDVIGLIGELGAGKTTLVRGLHGAMGCEGRVRSPSFTTLIEYQGDVPLHHFDLFGYESAGEGFLHEFEDWIFGQAVSAIEWFDRFVEPPRFAHLSVRLEESGEGRVAHVSPEGEAWLARASRLSERGVR